VNRPHITGAAERISAPRTNGGACAPIASAPFPGTSPVALANSSSPKGAPGKPVKRSTYSRIARAPGEAFDCDQIAWSCESCGRDEYTCFCEVDPEPAFIGEKMDIDEVNEKLAKFLADGWNRVEL
jgi:hypothetical protein